MTGLTETLDRLAPPDGWRDDWTDVLRRAGDDARPVSPPRRLQRRGRLRRRRTVLLVSVLAAIIAPLTALAAINHWWFLRAGNGLPRPAQKPVVVTRGSWSGHRWALVAYPSKPFNNGLCWGMTFSGKIPSPASHTGAALFGGMVGEEAALHGADDAIGCGSLVGIQKPHLVADLKAVGSPIPTAVMEWALTTAHGYPSWISGVVVSSATHVVLRWPAEKAQPGLPSSPRVVVRTPTFPASLVGYRVRFFATPVPKELPFQRVPIASSITGTNRHGAVVACYSLATGKPGAASPLSSCKP